MGGCLSTAFNVRPIPRVAILSFIVLAWRDIRNSIIEQFNHGIQFTRTRRCFIDVLFWIFEEAVPLALDAPALLVSGDLSIYKDTLQHLLPLFLRFQKQNYIVIASYLLAAIEKLRGGLW